MSEIPLLQVDDLACGYARQQVVEHLHLNLAAGDIGCLLGPSGCGKTTTLRAIAGFEPVQTGSIRLGGELVSRPGYTLAPEKRRIGMVFQDYALFPHLTVAQNIAFGIRHLPHASTVIGQMLELVNLGGLGQRHPHELSGGQQQRVALARALAPEPQLLLLDEPFSNLDVTLRKSLSLEVREILKQRGTTAVLVTHDQDEAFAVSDYVGVFNRGHLEQWDTPGNLYRAPASPFVARFIGQGYFVRGHWSSEGSVTSPLGRLPAMSANALHEGCAVDVLLRPDDVMHQPGSPLMGQVVSRHFQGASITYRLRLADHSEVQAHWPSDCEYWPGDTVGLVIKPLVRQVFPAA
jgi:iron(III) transport system ATP-binding protein